MSSLGRGGGGGRTQQYQSEDIDPMEMFNVFFGGGRAWRIFLAKS
jgi:hypothetical protein